MAKGKKQVKEVNPLYMTTREVAVRYKIEDVEAWKNANVKHVELTN